MLQSISWSEFFTVVLVTTSIYYLIVWLILFRGKLGFLPSLRPVAGHTEDGPDEILTSAQFIIDELRPLFPGRNNRSELLFALQVELRRYTGWEDPSFRETINRFIVNESQSKCSIRLSDDEVRALWE